MKIKKIHIYILNFFILFLFFIYIYLYRLSIGDMFDNKLRDEMFLIRGEINTTNSVAIVNIDEKSLKKLGQWPWSRDKIAKIIQNLTKANALIIGLDIFFPEVDSKSPAYLSKKYNLKLKNIDDLDYDKIFANTLLTTPTILGYYFDFESNVTKNYLPNIPAIFIEKFHTKDWLLEPKGYTGNIPILQNSAYSSGFINTVPDNIDGVVRYVPLLLKYDDGFYTSLAFEMFRIATGSRKIFINYATSENIGIDNIQIGKEKIKTDRFGRLFINYRGDRGKFPYLSAIDVYNNSFDKSLVKDKFILVGTTAGGLFDLRVTPFNTVYPGVEIHANLIDNLIKRDFIFRPDFAELLDITSLFIMALLISVIFYFFDAIVSLTILIGLTISYFYLVYYVLFHFGYIMNIVLPIFEMVVFAVFLGGINYLFEEKKSKNLKQAFSKKVSYKVMEELLHNETGDVLAPKDKEITIFFSDIRGFTSISEKLGNPTKVIQLLNYYMTPMVNNITTHKGTVDKFIGDAIMAYWNAPVDIPNHADEAVSSAIEQIKMLKQLNGEILTKFGIDLDIGIGINSGVATIGEMGSKGRADYTVIGDNVNLASRLEGLNKPYKTHILITEFTFALLKKDYIIREVDLVRVKGKKKPVKILQVIDFGKKEFKTHNEALNLYRNSKFAEAKIIFEKLFSETGDKLYQVYLERCEFLIKNPPQDFDGVWTFTTK